MSDAAEFVAWVEADADDPELVDDIRYRSFLERREFAVVSLSGGKNALLAGGTFAITLRLDDGGRPIVETPNGGERIVRLLWHTHPKPTGPSDADREFLRLLDQKESLIHEVNGPKGGIVFGPNKPGA